MTKGLLAERIFRLYKGGDPSDDSGLGIEDVKRMVVAQANLLLKTETLTLNKQFGEEAPTNLMLATYEDVSTEAWGTVQSRALLPAMPVSLPLNAGVWWVSPDADDATRHDQFIPMQQGQWNLIRNEEFIEGNLLLGNRTYEVDGKYLVFPTDITSTIPKLLIRLAVTDFDELGDYDLLPIPADYEEQIVQECLRLLGALPPAEVDDTNDANSKS